MRAPASSVCHVPRRAARAWVHLLVVIVALFTGLTAALPGTASAAPQTNPPASIALASQSAWVSRGQPFALRVTIASNLPRSGLDVGVTIYQRVTSRSSFRQTLQGRAAGGVLRSMAPTTVSSLPTDDAGATVLDVPTTGPPGPSLISCPGGCDGVYPVRVDLTDATTGSPLGHLITYLIFTNPGTTKLDFGAVIPFHAPPALSPGGQRQAPPSVSERLSTLVASLASYPAVPVTLNTTPETVQTLASSVRPRDISTLAILKVLAPETHQEVTSPFVPVDLPALADTGLGSEADLQVLRGDQVLAGIVGPHVDTSTWVTDGDISSTALGYLQSRAITRLVLPEADLTQYTGKLTLAQSFTLSGRNGYQPQAVSADPELGSYFTDYADPVLSAHQMLADLAVIYFEQPGDPSSRSVVAQAPLSWIPDPRFVNTLLSGLSTSPIVSPVTVGTIFGLRLPQSAPPLVRKLAGNGPPTSIPAGAIRVTRQKLNAFTSVVDQANSLISSFGDELLTAESSDLRYQNQARNLAVLRGKIDAQVSHVTLVPDRTVTLTARNGRIPITIVSNAPYVVHAVLNVASDKLTFPHGASQQVSLEPRDNARYVDVRSRSSGDFPMSVSLVSPHGGLVLLEARFTVRSTTASGVGIALSVGAGMILIGWWVRTFMHGRRQRPRAALHDG